MEQEKQEENSNPFTEEFDTNMRGVMMILIIIAAIVLGIAGLGQ